MVIHRCGQDDRRRAAAYRRRPAIFVLMATPAGRLDSYLIRHPRFVVERRSALKRHWEKLTVFRSAANSSAAFQSASLGCIGACLSLVLLWCRRDGFENFGFRGCVSLVRCGRPSLTQRRHVSTLEQSPESRRYGCDPDEDRGPRRPVARPTSDRPADEWRERPEGSNYEENAVAKGKRTFQPNNRRRARVHGFRLRMRTRAGRAIVSGRRRKGRRALTA